MQLKLTSLILLCCTPSKAFNNIGTCERTGPDGSSTKFCCDFFEKTSNGCIACTVGFESFNGTPCVPCKQNTYGKKCRNWCSCLTSQRCDHIHGCVEVLTTIELYQVTTDRSYYQHTNKCDPINGCVDVVTTLDLHQDVSNDEHIYVYIFGGSLTFSLMLLVIYYKIRWYRSTHVVISQGPETNQMPEVNGIESVYDEIDELSLDDMNQQPHRNSSSIEDDSSNSSGTTKVGTSNNEGYLNPYQPIIHNTDTHTYSLTSAAVSSTDEKIDDHICKEMCNQIYVNVKQDENTQKCLNNTVSQSRNNSDIPIDTNPVTIDLHRYKNTRIF